MVILVTTTRFPAASVHPAAHFSLCVTELLGEFRELIVARFLKEDTQFSIAE